MKPEFPPDAQPTGLYQLAILVLTVLVLFGIVADTLLLVPPEAARLLQIIDTLVCLVFLTDFGLGFYRAKSKVAFLKWGWIDLLASIPNVDILRWGRLARVLRIIRLFRGVRSVHKVFLASFHNRLQGGLISGLLIAFLVIVFSSVAVLVTEQGPDANIRTAEDALWWSMTTITTVGYGDRFPVTTEGHVVGAILMVCGVGLFGLLSGSIASMMLGNRRAGAVDLEQLDSRLAAIEKKLDALGANSPRFPPHDRGSGDGQVE